MCRQTDKDGCDKVIDAFHEYPIMPKNSYWQQRNWMDKTTELHGMWCTICR